VCSSDLGNAITSQIAKDAAEDAYEAADAMLIERAVKGEA